MIASKDEEKLPKFKAGMTPLELRELFEASLMAADAQSVKVTQLKPSNFGKLSGFSFEYNYKTKKVLEMKGIGLGVVHKYVFYALSYFGPKLYYFDKHKDEVETIFNSIKVLLKLHPSTGDFSHDRHSIQNRSKTRPDQGAH